MFFIYIFVLLYLTAIRTLHRKILSDSGKTGEVKLLEYNESGNIVNTHTTKVSKFMRIIVTLEVPTMKL